LPIDAAVIGLLYGSSFQSGNTGLSVLDCSEITIEKYGNGWGVVDAEIPKKVKLVTAVFSNMRLIGWYSFAKDVLKEHLSIHETIARHCEGNQAVYLRFEDVAPTQTSEVLPLTPYVTQDVQGSRIFVETPYRIASSEVENLGMQALMSVRPNSISSSLEQQQQKLHTTLTILTRKLDTMLLTLDKLEQSQSDENDINHTLRQKLLRKAGKIYHSLTSLSSTQGRDEAYTRDHELLACMGTLAALSKNSSAVAQLTETFHLAHSQRSGPF
jgi:hypothetical protein